jgi:dihydrofolate reductase
MRKLVVTENITVDGVIDAAEGWFSPAADEDVNVSDMVESIRRQREDADALLVGRQTFEDLRGYWPAQTDDTTGISDYLNAVQKYVVSKTLDDPQWEHTTVLSGTVEELVAGLKSEPGKDIVATGSMTLVRELVAKRLVDEYRLFLYPVVVGAGQRLFQDSDLVKLELLESTPFVSGVVLQRYRPS